MPFKEFSAKSYLGRENEIEGLQVIASQAAYGDANSVLLYGKRGVGKTELLKHVFNRLFHYQNDAVPFFYTIITPFASVGDFAKDYLGSFILQSLAFLNKDISLIHTGIYSFEDLIYIAKKSEAQWAVDIIEGHLKLREEGNPLRIFSHAMTAPANSYINIKKAVVVMIDDFHKMRKFCELNLEKYTNNFWAFFESSVISLHTPHIITGCKSGLDKIFFDETSLGSSFELINLQRLERNQSVKLFEALGKIHNVSIGPEISDCIDILNGNPFYIKNFMQAARQTCKTIAVDDFWQIYLGEVTKGKIFTYWTSVLKTYIPQFGLRKPSLKLLFDLCNSNRDLDIATLPDQLSIGHEDLNSIIEMLEASGTIEAGFSTFGIDDDEVLVDVIKGMYYREVERQPMESIREMILSNKYQRASRVLSSYFDLTIPCAHEAELVAVKLLEQAAKYYNIPMGTIGQLQVAMVEMFANIMNKSESADDSYNLKYDLKGDTFSIEIITSQKDLQILADDSMRIRAYLDDLKIERIMHGIKFTLVKLIKSDVVATN